MKKIFINTVIIAALLVAADLMVGLVAKKLITNLPDSTILESDIVQSMQNKQADILILGS